MGELWAFAAKSGLLAQVDASPLTMLLGTAGAGGLAVILTLLIRGDFRLKRENTDLHESHTRELAACGRETVEREGRIKRLQEERDKWQELAVQLLQSNQRLAGTTETAVKVAKSAIDLSGGGP